MSNEVSTSPETLPAVAVKWLIKNSSSNAELAILSNVCRRWRGIASVTILEEIVVQQSMVSENANQKRSPPPFSSLLLPSMVSFLTLPRKESSQDDLGTHSEETYCVAWFHPDGIEFKQLPEDAADDSDGDHLYMGTKQYGPATGIYAGDHRATSGEEAFAPSGELSYAGSDVEGRNGKKGSTRRNHKTRSPAPQSAVSVSASAAAHPSQQQPRDWVSCVYQWNGYSEAIDVLRPFGYAPSFVRQLLNDAQSHSSPVVTLQVDTETTRDVLASTHSSASSFSGRDFIGATPTFPPSSTFAVRGATYARPEGYCLCWDQDLLDTLYVSERGQDSKAVMRQQEWEAILLRRNRRRKELQREVLPVVLWSKRLRAPPQMTDTQPTASNMVDGAGIFQPCIQFLNVDSSHAVRLFTPPFEQGPISTPLTVFCVAIATEDGCFFSGLQKKFELGHLYPGNENDILIERSPICISADYIGPGSGLEEGARSIDEDKKMASLAMGRRTNSDLLHSDDSSCDMSYLEAAPGEQGWKCMCPFNGVGDLADDGESSSQEDHNIEGKGQVCRGRLGPGIWHCYVAVFDGEQSQIRVDGVEEPKSFDSRIPSSFKACLDGLTIGSDHTFDMSLCFGQGSDGEGEGAMAELAVFKGKLNVIDLMALEEHLMTKHGIPHPNRPSEEVATDDEYSRLAQGLLLQSCDASDDKVDGLMSLKPKPVPLRYFTKLRNVSWKQTNPVTGESISVQRIGTKCGNSSSDW